MSTKLRDMGANLDVENSGEDSNGDPLYDLGEVHEEQLLRERIQRGLTTNRGELFWAPEWGADLRASQNEPFTAARQSRILNGTSRFLSTLPMVVDFDISVEAEDGAHFLKGQIKTNDRVAKLKALRV